MKFRLVILSNAQNEMADAVDWYELQQPKLGMRFITFMERFFNRIVENPFLFPEKNPPFREAHVKAFPYLVIYQIRGEDVVVYSVFHTSRNAKNWENKL